MIGPEGQALPPGHGTAKEGAVVFAQRCAVCHGPNGQGGAVRRLVLGAPGAPHRGPYKESEKTALGYYPYATIVWDYIHRAMPASNPEARKRSRSFSIAAKSMCANTLSTTV